MCMMCSQDILQAIYYSYFGSIIIEFNPLCIMTNKIPESSAERFIEWFRLEGTAEIIYSNLLTRDASQLDSTSWRL